MSRTSQRVYLALAIAALLVLAVFIGVNFQDVEIDFVVFDADIKLAFALVIAAILGFLAGFVTHAFRR